MSWYYADGNQQVGPVDDAALDALVAQGKVGPDTLVWKAGMAGWQPYSQVGRPRPTPPPTPNVPPIPEPVQATPFVGATAPVQQAYCSQCGTPHAASEMVRFGDTLVCANCKDAYAQRLQQSAVPVGAYHYGGFWIRLLAIFIDGIILAIPMMMIQFVVMIAVGIVGSTSNQVDALVPLAGIAAGLLSAAIGLAGGLLYQGYFLTKYAATPGKMVCGLKVITVSGQPIGWGLAIARYLCHILSALPLYLGYIIAAFDVEKRTLHDRICNTRVVYKR